MTRRHWKFIEDLPPDWQKWNQEGLALLLAEWNELRKQLAEPQQMEVANRLKRRWAIETGILEGLYDIDRGLTETLIERGLDSSLLFHGGVSGADIQVVGALLRDQAQALDFVFDFVRQNRQLSTAYIKELHALLTRNQRTVCAVDQFGHLVEVELRRGDWKILPNNPVTPDGELHEYCPPEHVASEMDRLVKMHLEHVDRKVPEVVEAAWLHHRFTQIHPFQDGNGRVARALASLVLIRGGYFPLVVERDDRTRYLDALEEADDGDLSPLVKLFTEIEERAIRYALSIAEEVAKEPTTVDEAIEKKLASMSEITKALKQARQKLWELAEHLQIIAFKEMEAVAEKVSGEASGLLGCEPQVERSNEQTAHYFRYQVVQVAKMFRYFANMQSGHSWVRLRLPTVGGGSHNLLLSFHLVGPSNSMVMACSAITFRFEQVAPEVETLQALDIAPATDSVFLFTSRDTKDAVERKFRPWLDHALRVALKRWRL